MLFHVIWLPKNPTRRESIERQLEYASVNPKDVTFIEGVDGEKAIHDDKYIPLIDSGVVQRCKEGYRINDDDHCPGSVGCYFGHINVWNHIRFQSKIPDDEPCVILEDDSKLPHDFVQRLKRAIDQSTKHRPDWDVLVVTEHGFWGSTHISVHNLDAPNEKLVRPSVFTGLACYILRNKSVIPKLKSRVYPVTYGMDWYLSYLGRDDIIKLYIYTPTIVGLTELWQDPNTAMKYTPVEKFRIERNRTDNLGVPRFRISTNPEGSRNAVIIVSTVGIVLLAMVVFGMAYVSFVSNKSGENKKIKKQKHEKNSKKA